jgi:hypothetical protein
LIVPGLLYYQLDGFFDQQVINSLEERYQAKDLKDVSDQNTDIEDVSDQNPDLRYVIKQVKKFDFEGAALKRSIGILDSRIAKDADLVNGTADLLKFRNTLKAHLDSRIRRFHVVGFYPDPTIFLWSGLYGGGIGGSQHTSSGGTG